MSPFKIPPGLERIQKRMEDIGRKISGLDQGAEGLTPHSAQQNGSPVPAANPGASTFAGQLNGLIEAKGAEHGISPDLLKAVIGAESGGRTDARSDRGALGLMQLMPRTAADLGVNPNDPTQNLDGGSRYLKQMGQRFGTLDQALAAYNAGPGAVEKHGGVPPYRETQEYVRKVRQLLGKLQTGGRLDVKQ